MNKKIGFIIVGVTLLAIIIYFFYGAEKTPQLEKTSAIEKQAVSSQVFDKEEKINKKNEGADSLRNALQGVVQDSIDADVQEAVQSEVAKSQK